MFSQPMNNYFLGGTGGLGGESHGNGTGGAGGEGLGASLNCGILVQGGDVIMNNAFEKGERGLYILHSAVAAAAIHDSAESYPQPKCHPETRTEMLQDLHRWALDENAQQKILWLYGPAGAGKSAIMQTLARQLQDAKRLGGSFFFKRGHVTRGNGRTLFATIAYQLALSVPWLRTPISQIVENDPSVVRRTIETQMNNLIFEPCRSRENCDNVTILIDGLDECDGHDVQQEILRVIRIAASHSLISLRFIVASRPEPHIREAFDSAPSFHFNVEQSFHDVRKYLLDEFARIHREHSTMTHIALPWPSSGILWELVQKSSGYFIYASTIIKFIDAKSYRPTERLAMVLDGNNAASGASAFDALDQLYITVLSSAPREDEFMSILCIMAAYRERRIATIAELLGVDREDITLLLHGLHSVIKISHDAISPYHASFLDFLNNASRSQKFHIHNPEYRMYLARCFLRFTAGHYRRVDLDKLSPSQQLIYQELLPLIISLPPSAELCPLVERMNHNHIFNLKYNLGCMLSWLNKISSAPRDLIQVWQDYAFLSSFQESGGNAEVETHSKISRDSKDIVLPSHDCIFLQAVVAMVFLDIPLWRVSSFTGITWDELKASICSIPPIISRYDGPPMNAMMRLLPREAYSRACRDLALRFIPRMLKNPLSQPQMPNDEHHVWGRFPLLVRLSPPCPKLYHELWLIPLPPTIWLYLAEMAIHHVSKWLHSFPNPTLGLIAFWRDGRASEYHPWQLPDWEDGWRQHLDRWNKTITRLDLPDNLNFPL